MGGCRGLGHPGMLELEVLVAEVLEHPGAAAEQHRDQVDRQLVDEAGLQVLPPLACFRVSSIPPVTKV
jgi:hypothetical protein